MFFISILFYLFLVISRLDPCGVTAFSLQCLLFSLLYSLCCYKEKKNIGYYYTVHPPPRSSTHIHRAYFNFQPALCNTLNVIRTNVIRIILIHVISMIRHVFVGRIIDINLIKNYYFTADFGTSL